MHDIASQPLEGSAFGFNQEFFADVFSLVDMGKSEVALGMTNRTIMSWELIFWWPFYEHPSSVDLPFELCEFALQEALWNADNCFSHPSMPRS